MILGTVAFISFQGFSKEARDTKRISDVRSLYSAINLKNTTGTDLSELIINTTKTQDQILGVSGQSINTFGTVDFAKLNENPENFKDPSNGINYPVAFAEGNNGTEGYSFIQIATISEVSQTTKIIGDYYTKEDGDAKSLFPDGTGYFVNGGDKIYDEDTGEKGNLTNKYEGLAGIEYGTIEYNGYINGTEQDFFVRREIIIRDGNGSGHTIMDRNLGASDSGTGTNSFGNYYQWGNNYPFPSTNTGAYTPNSTERIQVTSANENSNFTGTGVFVLVTENSGLEGHNYGWAEAENYNILANLWGGVGDTLTKNGNGTNKDRQGPCPNGYHVPSRLEWLTLYNIGDTEGWWSSTDGDGTQNSLLMPAAGGLSRKNAIIEFNISNDSKMGVYWSSSELKDELKNHYGSPVFAFRNIGGHTSPDMSTAWASGHPVRCFKN